MIGATNLPKELDPAAKRRFSKLIFVGQPDKTSREEMLMSNLIDVKFEMGKN